MLKVLPWVLNRIALMWLIVWHTFRKRCQRSIGAEDLLGLGKHTVSSQFRLKSLTERAETSQIEVVRDQADKVLARALEVAEELSSAREHGAR